MTVFGSGPLTEIMRQRLEILLWWVLPPIVIPSLRWLQDPPKLKNKLFIRDFTTYSIGAVVFFAVKYLSEAAAGPFIKNLQAKCLLGSAVGLAANLLYAGIGAIKLSQWLTNRSGQRAALLPEKRQRPASNIVINIRPPATFHAFYSGIRL